MVSPLIKKELNIGDRVKILNVNKIRKSALHFNNGDITEVVGMSKGKPFLKSIKQPGKTFYVFWFEMEYIEVCIRRGIL